MPPGHGRHPPDKAHPPAITVRFCSNLDKRAELYEVILLLLAGDKRTQNADIDEAIYCLKDYLKR